MNYDKAKNEGYEKGLNEQSQLVQKLQNQLRDFQLKDKDEFKIKIIDLRNQVSDLEKEKADAVEFSS